MRNCTGKCIWKKMQGKAGILCYRDNPFFFGIYLSLRGAARVILI